MYVVRTRSGQMFIAEAYGQDVVFSDKVAFTGLRGVKESSIPALNVTSMNMDKADVLYILGGTVDGTDVPEVPDKAKLTLVHGGGE